jgi:hypothetical protein
LYSYPGKKLENKTGTEFSLQLKKFNMIYIHVYIRRIWNPDNNNYDKTTLNTLDLFGMLLDYSLHFVHEIIITHMQ